MPRRFLAFDPGSVTGWTRGSSLEDMASGTIDLRDYKNDGRKGMVLQRRAERLIGFDAPEHERVTTVLIEPPFSTGNQSDALLFGISFMLQTVAEQLGCECYGIPIAHWRSKFLGSRWVTPRRNRSERDKRKWRQALKDAAVERCRVIGHPVANDHEAESVGIYFAGIIKWAPPGFRLPAAFLGPLFEERNRDGTNP